VYICWLNSRLNQSPVRHHVLLLSVEKTLLGSDEMVSGAKKVKNSAALQNARIQCALSDVYCPKASAEKPLNEKPLNANQKTSSKKILNQKIWFTLKERHFENSATKTNITKKFLFLKNWFARLKASFHVFILIELF
jgi:hypothetical protein